MVEAPGVECEPRRVSNFLVARDFWAISLNRRQFTIPVASTGFFRRLRESTLVLER